MLSLRIVDSWKRPWLCWCGWSFRRIGSGSMRLGEGTSCSSFGCLRGVIDLGEIERGHSETKMGRNVQALICFYSARI